MLKENGAPPGRQVGRHRGARAGARLQGAACLDAAHLRRGGRRHRPDRGQARRAQASAGRGVRRFRRLVDDAALGGRMNVRRAASDVDSCMTLARLCRAWERAARLVPAAGAACRGDLAAARRRRCEDRGDQSPAYDTGQGVETRRLPLLDVVTERPTRTLIPAGKLHATKPSLLIRARLPAEPARWQQFHVAAHSTSAPATSRCRAEERSSSARLALAPSLIWSTRHALPAARNGSAAEHENADSNWLVRSPAPNTSSSAGASWPPPPSHRAAMVAPYRGHDRPPN